MFQELVRIRWNDWMGRYDVDSEVAAVQAVKTLPGKNRAQSLGSRILHCLNLASFHHGGTESRRKPADL